MLKMECTICGKDYKTYKKTSKYCSLECLYVSRKDTAIKTKHVIIDGLTCKSCTQCNLIKPLDDFHDVKTVSDGKNSYCKECRNSKEREYRKNNKRTKSLKSSHEQNILKYKKYKDGLITNTYEPRKESRQKWRDNNKDRIRIYRVARKTKKKNGICCFNKNDWDNCREHFNYSCAYCGCAVDVLTQDHFQPLSKGGEYTINNIIPACHRCNSSKGNKSFFEWYYQQEHYNKKSEQKILSYLNYKSEQQQLSILF